METNRVREIRKALGLRQSDIARRGKLSLRTVNSIERGRACRLDTKRKVLRALGMPFTQRAEVFTEAPQSWLDVHCPPEAEGAAAGEALLADTDCGTCTTWGGEEFPSLWSIDCRRRFNEPCACPCHRSSAPLASPASEERAS